MGYGQWEGRKKQEKQDGKYGEGKAPRIPFVEGEATRAPENRIPPPGNEWGKGQRKEQYFDGTSSTDPLRLGSLTQFIPPITNLS